MLRGPGELASHVFIVLRGPGESSSIAVVGVSGPVAAGRLDHRKSSLARSSRWFLGGGGGGGRGGTASPGQVKLEVGQANPNMGR